MQGSTFPNVGSKFRTPGLKSHQQASEGIARHSGHSEPDISDPAPIFKAQGSRFYAEDIESKAPRSRFNVRDQRSKTESLSFTAPRSRFNVGDLRSKILRLTSQPPCGVFLDALQDIQGTTDAVLIRRYHEPGLWRNRLRHAFGDLTTNNFAFQGFPEVQVTYSEKTFEVSIRVGEAAAGPFTLDEKVGTAEARRFEKGGTVSEAFSKIVQGWVIELESAAG